MIDCKDSNGSCSNSFASIKAFPTFAYKRTFSLSFSVFLKIEFDAQKNLRKDTFLRVYYSDKKGVYFLFVGSDPIFL
ncbi:hypothetical protein BLX87_14545 [Bacillus sp. VT-16-64]|nr:hypothetical protein BLX87_14545 [Bacillus sp. VT-16-64]